MIKRTCCAAEWDIGDETACVSHGGMDVKSAVGLLRFCVGCVHLPDHPPSTEI